MKTIEFNPFEFLMYGGKTKEEEIIEELVKPLEDKMIELNKNIEVWENKVYKENNKVIKFDNTEIVGEIPYKEYEQKSITYINEKRRVNKIKAMQEEIKDIEKHIRAIKMMDKYFDRDKMEIIDYKESIEKLK